jgi:hypothetical protein
MVDRKTSQEPTGTTPADADFFRAVQGGGNVKFTFALVKTWARAWLAKSDVGLGSVDNTSDITKWESTKTLKNSVLDNTNSATLKDTAFTLQDDGDVTKQARFQLSGIATATLRTYTLPNASTTLVGADTTQTLTNKSVDAASNTISNIATSMFAVNVVDTDGTLAANSDTRIASQKATKSYVAAYIAAQDVEVLKGAIDCSANPNYPAADAGHVYRVSVAGRIGGASGPRVEQGDRLECFVDATAAGTQATVGANWIISQVNIDGAVVGPTSAADGTPAVYDGTSGRLLKNITYAAFKTLLALVKGDVGLGNVDNTSDAGKPVSTAQATAIGLKQTAAPILTDLSAITAATGDIVFFNGANWVKLAAGTTGQFLKIDSTPSWATISGGGDVLASNNGSDFTNKATVRTNLAVPGTATPNTFTGVQTFAAGSAGAPSLIGPAGTGSGLWFPSSTTVAMSGNGVEFLRVSNGGLGRASAFGALMTATSSNILCIKGPGTSGAIGAIDFCDSALTQCGAIIVDQTAHTTSYQGSSDIRGKPTRKLLDPAEAVSVVKRLRIWDFDADGNTIRGVGVLAQEAYEVVPRMVTKGDDNPDLVPGDEGYEGWYAEKAGPVPYLVAALQLALDRIDALEARLENV